MARNQKNKTTSKKYNNNNNNSKIPNEFAKNTRNKDPDKGNNQEKWL